MLSHLLAQTYTYTTTSNDGGAGFALFSGIWLIVWLAVLVLFLVAMWKLYEKAGQPGWASIIPFYNVYILLKIAGRPGWWLLLFFIPFVNIVVSIVIAIDIARHFGYSDVFGAILCGLLGIGYLIIGLGSAQYSADATPVGQAPGQSPPAATPPAAAPPQA